MHPKTPSKKSPRSRTAWRAKKSPRKAAPQLAQKMAAHVETVQRAKHQMQYIVEPQLRELQAQANETQNRLARHIARLQSAEKNLADHEQKIGNAEHRIESLIARALKDRRRAQHLERCLLLLVNEISEVVEFRHEMKNQFDDFAKKLRNAIELFEI